MPEACLRLTQIPPPAQSSPYKRSRGEPAHTRLDGHTLTELSSGGSVPGAPPPVPIPHFSPGSLPTQGLSLSALTAPYLLEGLLVGQEGADHLRQRHGDTAHALREGSQQAHTLFHPVLVAREAMQPKQIVGRHGVGAGLCAILVCRAQGSAAMSEDHWVPGPCPRVVARMEKSLCPPTPAGV